MPFKYRDLVQGNTQKSGKKGFAKKMDSFQNVLIITQVLTQYSPCTNRKYQYSENKHTYKKYAT